MNPSGGHKSPHKVCMLLAVMDLIESGQINNNRIYFNELLITQFSKYFNVYRQSVDRDKPYQPFFYLNSEGFWHHQVNKGQEVEYDLRNRERKAGSEGVVKRLIDYTYLDENLFTLLQNRDERNRLRLALGANIKDYSTLFERWALDIGKSSKTVTNYLQAIGGSISNWVAEAAITDQNLLSIYSYKQFNDIIEKARLLETFRLRDDKGKGMYSAAVKCYGEFLVDLSQEALAEDIQSIMTDNALEATTRETLVNARIGQGQFRSNLIAFWNGCALTGYQNEDFLIASHIKPWSKSSNSERLDLYNGILLLANLDKAFDKGYITFTPKGKIKISNALEQPDVVGVDIGMTIRLTDAHQPYLDFHRQNQFIW